MLFFTWGWVRTLHTKATLRGKVIQQPWDRAKHPGMWTQVGPRKHHYEQSLWRWWNSSWATTNPERWCCESAELNMSANLEKSAVATGLEKDSFHSNPKESESEVAQLCPTLATPWTVPTRLLRPWDFPGKSIGVGCHLKAMSRNAQTTTQLNASHSLVK